MNFSSRTRSNKSQDKTVLQQLHDQASELLSQKNDEITALNNELENAEKKLADLKYSLKSQQADNTETSDASDIDDDAVPPEDLKELEEIKAKNEQEIQKLNEANEEEVAQLEECYEKQLKDAEEWAEQHAEQIFIEKQTEHQQLLKELDSLKEKLAESEFASTQTKFQLLEESKTTSMTNAQKIQYLEAQLGELNSLMRDEIRAIRAKIEETVTAYNMRTKDHQIEIERYQNEIEIRNKKYEQHIEALQQQFNCEKNRYETTINTSEQKYNSLQKVIKQLERQHEKQISTALKDNEKLKATIYTIRSRDDPDLEFTRTAITQSHMQEQRIQQLESDIKITDEEIKELMLENRGLEQQIAKYQKAAEQRKQPSKY